MPRRERIVVHGISAAVAVGMVPAALLLPWNRDFDPLVAIALVAVFALLAAVTSEIGRGFGTPDEVGLVPLLFLVPLPLVAPLVALGYLLSDLPDVLGRRAHPDRLPPALLNSAGALGAAVTVGLVGPDARGTDAVGVLALALVAQWALLIVCTLAGTWLGSRAPLANPIRALGFALWIDTLLWPIGALVAFGADAFPPAVLAPLGLVSLLRTFSRERSEREAAALELNRAYQGTVAVLADVVEADDSYTAEHCRSVVNLATAVAGELGLPRADGQELEFAALLHDVGKLSIPREILDKPSAFTAEEFAVIKTHTLEGERILSRVGGLLARVGRIVRSCHERWDGGGYPDGLAGEEIPLAARIVFCSDAYNAMTTDRPYRRSIGRNAALREIEANAGTQFDPRVAAALRAVVLRDGDAAGPAEHRPRARAAGGRVKQAR